MSTDGQHDDPAHLPPPRFEQPRPAASFWVAGVVALPALAGYLIHAAGSNEGLAHLTELLCVLFMPVGLALHPTLQGRRPLARYGWAWAAIGLGLAIALALFIVGIVLLLLLIPDGYEF